MNKSDSGTEVSVSVGVTVGGVVGESVGGVVGEIVGGVVGVSEAIGNVGVKVGEDSVTIMLGGVASGPALIHLNNK